MGTEIRPIPGFRGYHASKDGQILSTRVYSEPKVLRPAPNPDGYLHVHLQTDGSKKGRTFSVHRLVAIAFLAPGKEGQDQVRHLDGKRQHNHADNLAWGTTAENGEDTARHGSQANERNANASLVPAQVEEIRRLALSGMSRAETGRRFGITASHVTKVVNGRCWGPR